MNSASKPGESPDRIGILKRIEQLMAALSDPARRERAVLIVLTGYVAIWTLYGVLAKASQDVQFDAAELITLAREPALGYAKHPPLAPWLVRIWFSLFPVSDWAYYLLAMLYAAAGLWLAWRLFGLLLDSGKRIVALSCLTLVPYFNFHGLRFDHNAALGALWAATTLCFIRSFITRGAGWAALAGIAAAAAMLGKYWSVFLLAGLALAALIDARRAVYFRSAAPWITIAVGVLVLAPHLAWLARHEFMPMSYAVGTHSAKTLGQAIRSAAGFLAGGAGYAAVPVLMVLALARPSSSALLDVLIPREHDRQFVAVVFWATLLLPATLSAAFGFELSPLWAMSGLILMPPVLLSSPLLAMNRQAALQIVAFAVAVPPVMLVASPAIGLAVHLAGVTPTGAHARLLAERIQQEWQRTTDRPLRIVGGDFDLAYVTAFYLPAPLSAFPVLEPENAPNVTPERLAREGAAFACFMFYDRREGQKCRDLPVSWAVDKIAAGNPATRRVELVITRVFFGIAGEPARYLITLVPPRL